MWRVANTTVYTRSAIDRTPPPPPPPIEPNRKRKFGLQNKNFGSTSSGVLQPGPPEIWRGPFRKPNRKFGLQNLLTKENFPESFQTFKNKTSFWLKIVSALIELPWRSLTSADVPAPSQAVRFSPKRPSIECWPWPRQPRVRRQRWHVGQPEIMTIRSLNYFAELSYTSVKKQTVTNQKNLHKKERRKSAIDFLTKNVLSQFSNWTDESFGDSHFCHLVLAPENRNKPSYWQTAVVKEVRWSAHLWIEWLCVLLKQLADALSNVWGNLAGIEHNNLFLYTSLPEKTAQERTEVSRLISPELATPKSHLQWSTIPPNPEQASEGKSASNAGQVEF